MEASCHEFVDALAKCSVPLQAALRETVEDWRPDEPPVTVLFAALGDRIAERFDEEGIEVNQTLLRLVESAMNSGDTNLVTAVATGLIEGLLAKAWRKEGLWSRISPMLGERSRRHADAWSSA